MQCRIGAKDIGLACEQAKLLGLDATVFEAANATFKRAIEMGLGENEMATLARYALLAPSCFEAVKVCMRPFSDR